MIKEYNNIYLNSDKIQIENLINKLIRTVIIKNEKLKNQILYVELINNLKKIKILGMGLETCFNRNKKAPIKGAK